MSFLSDWGLSGIIPSLNQIIVYDKVRKVSSEKESTFVRGFLRVSFKPYGYKT